ncbi:MAG: hypothetical protein ABSF64_13345 [Bryobacteraceae bacterium]|jgi:hypothetical protein
MSQSAQLCATAAPGRAIADSGFIPLLLFGGGFISIALQSSGGRLGSGYEIVETARCLALHGTFANPFSVLPTGPSAHCAPLYPAFLALLIRIFGYSTAYAQVAFLCSMAMHALHAALLPYVSELFFRDRRPGIWAGAIGIVFPVFYFFPQFEIMYAAVGLMLFCLAATRLARGAGVWRGFACGLLAGLLALLSPATVMITGLWLVFLVWRHSVTRPWKFLAWAALGGVLTLSPWTFRNYQVFHMLVPVRDDMGLELYVSNNDLAEPSFSLNGASHEMKHPNGSLPEARAVRAMGEAQYSRARGATALAWISSHPARFLRLTATRVRMFWLSEAQDYPWHHASIIWTTLASALGLLLLAIRREPAGIFIAAVSLMYPLLYYSVQFDPRYRVPILWLTLLGAGYLLSSVWDLAAGPRPQARTGATLD